jgi:hypothetical protein
MNLCSYYALPTSLQPERITCRFALPLFYHDTIPHQFFRPPLPPHTLLYA